MDSTKKLEAGGDPPIKEEVFIIDDEVKVDLAKVRPLKLEPVDRDIAHAEPQPSTSSAAVAEVRLNAPPPAFNDFKDFKVDPFQLAPRARFSPPPPPAERAKRRSVPGGHDSARPRLKFLPYQARR